MANIKISDLQYTKVKLTSYSIQREITEVSEAFQIYGGNAHDTVNGTFVQGGGGGSGLRICRCVCLY